MTTDERRIPGMLLMAVAVMLALIAVVSLTVREVSAQSTSITAVDVDPEVSSVEITATIEATGSATVYLRYRRQGTSTWVNATSRTRTGDGDVTWDLDKLHAETRYQGHISLSPLHITPTEISWTMQRGAFHADNFAAQRYLGNPSSGGFNLGADDANATWSGTQFVAMALGNTAYVYSWDNILTGPEVRREVELPDGTAPNWGIAYGDGVFVVQEGREFYTFDALTGSTITTGAASSTYDTEPAPLGVVESMVYDSANSRWVTVDFQNEIHAIGDITDVAGTTSLLGTFSDGNLESLVVTSEGWIGTASVRNDTNTGNERILLRIPDITDPDAYQHLGVLDDRLYGTVLTASRRSERNKIQLVWTGADLLALNSGLYRSGTNRRPNVVLIHRQPAGIGIFRAQSLTTEPELFVQGQSLPVGEDVTVYVRAKLTSAADWIELPTMVINNADTRATWVLPPSLRVAGDYEAEASINADYSFPALIEYNLPLPSAFVRSVTLTNPAAEEPQITATFGNLTANVDVYARIRNQGTATWTELPAGVVTASAGAFSWTLDRATYGVGSYEVEVSLHADYSEPTFVVVTLAAPPPGIALIEVNLDSDPRTLSVTAQSAGSGQTVYARIRRVEVPEATWTDLVPMIATDASPRVSWTIPSALTNPGTHVVAVSLASDYSTATGFYHYTIQPDTESSGSLDISWALNASSRDSHRFGFGASSQSLSVNAVGGGAGFLLTGNSVLMDSYIVAQLFGDERADIAVLAAPGDTIVTRSVSGGADFEERANIQSRLLGAVPLGEGGADTGDGLPDTETLARPFGGIFRFRGGLAGSHESTQLALSGVRFEILEIEAGADGAYLMQQILAGGSRIGPDIGIVNRESEGVSLLYAGQIELDRFLEEEDNLESDRVTTTGSRTVGGGFNSAVYSYELQHSTSGTFRLAAAITNLELIGPTAPEPVLQATLGSTRGTETVYARVREDGTTTWTELDPQQAGVAPAVALWPLDRADYPPDDYNAEASLASNYSEPVELDFEILSAVPGGLTVMPDATDLSALVSWDEVAGTDIVYDLRWRLFEEEDQWVSVLDITDTQHTLLSLEASTAYAVQVRVQAGDWSESVTWTMPVREVIRVRPTPTVDYNWCFEGQILDTLTLSPGEQFDAIEGRVTFTSFSVVAGKALVTLSPPHDGLRVSAVDGHEIDCTLTSVSGGAVTFSTDDLPSGTTFDGSDRELTLVSRVVQDRAIAPARLTLKETICSSLGEGCGILGVTVFGLAIMGSLWGAMKIPTWGPILVFGSGMAGVMFMAIVISSPFIWLMFLAPPMLAGAVWFARNR